MPYFDIVLHSLSWSSSSLKSTFDPDQVAAGYIPSCTNLHVDLPARPGPFWPPVDSGASPKLSLSSSFHSLFNNTHNVYASSKTYIVDLNALYLVPGMG